MQRLTGRDTTILMASKNSVKIYSPNSYYHLYNRGVEQRSIFLDAQDYAVFLSYLKTYLLPKNVISLQKIITSENASPKEKDNALKMLKLKNYCEDIELLCYALLPNHFHLLIKNNADCMDAFMNSLGTRYAMFFNRKYKRKGVLFQDVYKGVMVESDMQLLHLSRYIHLNPIKATGVPIMQWKEVTYPSSLPEYFGTRETPWIKKDHVIDHFSQTNERLSYQDFMGLSIDPEIIYNLALDYDID